MRKAFAIMLLFLVSVFTLRAQQKAIIKLLNDQFAKEQIMYPADYINKPVLFHPYTIERDTIKFALKTTYQQDSAVLLLQVPLRYITSVDKDINILFKTQDDQVLTRTYALQNGVKGALISEQHLPIFFTSLSRDQDDARFRKLLLKAFKRAGFPITSNYWAH